MVSPLYLFASPGYCALNQPVSFKYDSACSMEDILEDHEKETVAQVWSAPGGPASKGWRSNPIAWLRDTTDGLSFGRSEYSIYLALALHPEQFSDRLRNTFCGAVGCAVTTADDQVVVQERASGLLAPHLLDSSAAGMIVITDGRMDPESQIREKLSRELGIQNIDFTMTGVHGSQDYVSTQVTYKCRIPLSFAELKEKANPTFMERVIGVPESKLGTFVLNHYVEGHEPKMIGDGVGVFLAAMELSKRMTYRNILNMRGAQISYARLEQEKIIAD